MWGGGHQNFDRDGIAVRVLTHFISEQARKSQRGGGGHCQESGRRWERSTGKFRNPVGEEGLVTSRDRPTFTGEGGKADR